MQCHGVLLLVERVGFYNVISKKVRVPKCVSLRTPFTKNSIFHHRGTARRGVLCWSKTKNSAFILLKEYVCPENAGLLIKHPNIYLSFNKNTIESRLNNLTMVPCYCARLEIEIRTLKVVSTGKKLTTPNYNEKMHECSFPRKIFRGRWIYLADTVLGIQELLGPSKFSRK